MSNPGPSNQRSGHNGGVGTRGTKSPQGQPAGSGQEKIQGGANKTRTGIKQGEPNAGEQHNSQSRLREYGSGGPAALTSGGSTGSRDKGSEDEATPRKREETMEEKLLEDDLFVRINITVNPRLFAGDRGQAIFAALTTKYQLIMSKDTYSLTGKWTDVMEARNAMREYCQKNVHPSNENIHQSENEERPGNELVQNEKGGEENGGKKEIKLTKEIQTTGTNTETLPDHGQERHKIDPYTINIDELDWKYISSKYKKELNEIEENYNIRLESQYSCKITERSGKQIDRQGVRERLEAMLLGYQETLAHIVLDDCYNIDKLQQKCPSIVFVKTSGNSLVAVAEREELQKLRHYIQSTFKEDVIPMNISEASPTSPGTADRHGVEDWKRSDNALMDCTQQSIISRAMGYEPEEDESMDDLYQKNQRGFSFLHGYWHSEHGQKVFISEADITKLRVGAIVNAANERLEHGGGVAGAILKAAGEQIQKESREIVKRNGKVPVGRAVSTQAYHLPCESVIHAVGPAWDDYKGRDKEKEVETDLYDAVFNSLQKAEQMKLTSIAIPAISSDDDVFNMFEPFMAAARDEWSSNIQRSGDAADSTAYKRKQIYANEAAARHSDAKENLFPDIFSSIHHKSKEKCSICLGYIEDAQSMKKCKHVFCRGCISEALSHKPVCPICGEIYGALRGNQPDGNMLVHKNPKLKLPGFKCGSIIIEYILPGGRQTDQHPDPGRSYGPLHRCAYLPDNKEGKEISGLLRRAFDARLVFTIGRSVTSGKEGVITWNDIHHKTSPDGKFGYPDKTYLSRVRGELAAKGIK